VIILVAILEPPAQDGRDLTSQEGGALGWGKGAGQTGKGLAYGVVDPPAVAVADQVNGVAGAGSGDGLQPRITWLQAPGKGQVHQLWVRRHIAQAGTRQGGGVKGDAAGQDRIARVMAT